MNSLPAPGAPFVINYTIFDCSPCGDFIIQNMFVFMLLFFIFSLLLILYVSFLTRKVKGLERVIKDAKNRR